MLFVNRNYNDIARAIAHEFFMIQELYEEWEAPDQDKTLNQEMIDEAGRFQALQIVWQARVKPMLKQKDKNDSDLQQIVDTVQQICNSIKSADMIPHARRLLLIVDNGCQQIQSIWKREKVNNHI